MQTARHTQKTGMARCATGRWASSRRSSAFRDNKASHELGGHAPCVPLLSKCNYEGSLLDSRMWHCLDTLLTLLLWVVSLVLSPLFPPSLPGDCFTRRAYDILCMLSALLYKIIGKTFFFSHLDSPSMVFWLVWLPCHL